MTKPCSGCGLRFCDGIECYLADPDPSDDDSGKPLSQWIAEQEQLTRVQSDPLLRKRRAA